MLVRIDPAFDLVLRIYGSMTKGRAKGFRKNDFPIGTKSAKSQAFMKANKIIEVLVLTIALSLGMVAAAAPKLPPGRDGTKCAAELTQKPALTVVTDAFAKVARDDRFLNEPVTVALIVPTQWESETMATLRKRLSAPNGNLLFFDLAFSFDNETLIYLHLDGRDLRYIAPYPDAAAVGLGHVRAFDIEFESKVKLGLDPFFSNHKLSPDLLKFNARLLDPLMRFPDSQFRVLVGTRKKDFTKLAERLRQLHEFEILDHNVGGFDQFILLRGRGENLLKLRAIRSVTSVESAHK